MRASAHLRVLLACCALAALRPSLVSGQTPAPPADGQHDFDWELGQWKTELRRLVRPLTGSTEWAEYVGTTNVTPLLGGRANIVELVAEGPAGRMEGMSLRLYNPTTRQWSLNFAAPSSGMMATPVFGEFRNGRGDFYGTDTSGGRTVLVRFVITNIDDRSWRFEQAYSDDGGKTWEVNWIVTDTRIGAAPAAR